MFRQKTEKDDFAMVTASEQIEFQESCIIKDQKLNLITWTPDPKQMPDCSFIIQHQFCAQYVVSYLQGCSCGIICVEATEAGNPHYHGWYQTSDNFEQEQFRIRWMKVLRNAGNVKTTAAFDKKAILINTWYQKGNVLYYYKKELVGCGLHIPFNPITSTTIVPEPDISGLWFNIPARKTAKQLLERKSTIQRMFEFYGEV